MREIKFRAWDVSQKLMIDWETIRCNIGWYLDDDQITLMQYTGLKDNNGVEAYQGDIIKISDKTYEIKYGEYDIFVEEYGSAGIGFYIKQKTPFGYEYGAFVRGDFEIIGNIYENPELLKSDNQ